MIMLYKEAIVRAAISSDLVHETRKKLNSTCSGIVRKKQISGVLNWLREMDESFDWFCSRPRSSAHLEGLFSHRISVNLGLPHGVVRKITSYARNLNENFQRSGLKSEFSSVLATVIWIISCSTFEDLLRFLFEVYSS